MYWDEQECRDYMDTKCKAEQYINGDDCKRYGDHKQKHDKEENASTHSTLLRTQIHLASVHPTSTL